MSRIVDPKKLRPVANRVLIQKDDKNNKDGKILLSDNEKKNTKQLTGKVIAVGNGRNGEKMITKKGDIVIFGEYSGTQIGKEEDNLIVIEEHHILCIIDNKSKTK